MALTPGTRLGVYDIIAPIGEGGMGQVYRARDTKLDRDVAIKILPEAFAHDRDRLARFQREAKTLASLNHPHIAGIYGLEESGGVSALVMELVAGEDLSQRIARGAMPVDEALSIAKQMAEALEAAHEQGIIHRDLKPANIKVRDDGTVKVLDFGLAKALDQGSGARDQGSGHASMSPTITTPAMTQAGMILGTAAYMAPEQAKGRSVDRRADVWAFGAVLYEMLSGRRAFEGEDISDTLANVLKTEPDWRRLPVAVPLGVRQTLRACLQKDPKQRIGDMQSVRLALEGAFETAGPQEAPVVTQPAGWRRVAAVGVATAIMGGLITGTVAWRFRAPPAPAIVTFPLVLPDDQVLTRPPSIALSPDGTRIAYVANEQIYVRSMNEMESRPIPGTNFDPYRPFFSPDSQWIGFFSFQDNTLKKIAIAGGSALTVCKVSFNNAYGASWYGEQIVFADPGKGIMRVSANAGEPIVLAEVKPPEVPDGPQMLDDDTLLFTTTAESGPTRWDKAQIVVQALRSGERKVVFRGGTGRYVPTGHLVYALGTTLLALPFDVAAREVRGGPVSLLEGVRRAANPATQSGVAGFGVSPTGALVYFPGTADTSAARNILASVDRTGKIDPLALPAQPYLHPRMSPKGDQLAVATDDGRDANIWIADLKSGGSARRLTFGGRNLFPIWTPDGRSVTFQSDRDGDRGIFQQLADGSGVADRLTKGEQGSTARQAPESWSPDGKTLAFRVGNSPSNMSLWILTIGDKTPKRFDETITAGHFNSSFSPDGRWLSYASSEASPGSPRIFVQPFPRTGAKYQLTSADSASPQWSPDGRQIIYDEGQYTRRLMALDVRTTPGFTFGNPTPILTPGIDKPAGYWRPYDLTPDGKRIIIVSAPQADSKGTVLRTQINVVLNWFEELKARVPTK